MGATTVNNYNINLGTEMIVGGFDPSAFKFKGAGQINGGKIASDLENFFKDLGELFEGNSNSSDSAGITRGGCCHHPQVGDGCHPQGSLKSDTASGTVTTAGGYKIEQDGQYNWKITGPDGKSTSITGDPHVAESDGGRWDFKRDSTFVLGDGTRINVKTKDYGNGMTVTSGLDIISGNDHVAVSGISEGKGKAGEVTQDGYQHVNDFAGKDVFVMGKDSDDWAMKGKEVVGSENGGESFKLGDDLPAGNTGGRNTTGKQNATTNDELKELLSMFKSFMNGSMGGNSIDKLFSNWDNNKSWQSNKLGTNPYDGGNQTPPWQNNAGGGNRYNHHHHRNHLSHAFHDLKNMFKMLELLGGFSNDFQTNRNRLMAV